ncbi:hypothetical protein NSA19_02965 [Actinomyces bowdenii]|uniref:hypothetical protein n=1 Tax=Actinomyces bowdenii TaxID=131109 RepID=UPI00214AA04D|nr:hypothetical protein [Actinomyces bowdenii]MCR2051830.1 hypothetical protein [Actinomyces bowdenii]
MSMETTVLLSVPAILALTTLAKRLGVRGQWSMLVAVVLGGCLAAAQHYLGNDPGFQAIAQGVLLGLSAAGLFDVAKEAGLSPASPEAAAEPAAPAAPTAG